MSEIELYYFPGIHARAEPIRMMFAYAGKTFKDTPAMDFGKKKKGNELPFDQVPLLTVDGKTFSQSGAICRYVAKHCGLYPSDDFLAAKSGEAFEASQDLQYDINPLVNVYRKEQFTKQAKRFLGKMNKDLQNVSDCLGSQDFFAGSSVSFGDFSMFHSLLNIQTLFGEEALAAYPSLVAYCTRMKALNGVSEYLSKRNPKPMNLGKGKELFSKMQR